MHPFFFFLFDCLFWFYLSQLHCFLSPSEIAVLSCLVCLLFKVTGTDYSNLSCIIQFSFSRFYYFLSKIVFEQKIFNSVSHSYFRFPETTHDAEKLGLQSYRVAGVSYELCVGCYRRWAAQGGGFESHCWPQFSQAFRHSVTHPVFSLQKISGFLITEVLYSKIIRFLTEIKQSFLNFSWIVKKPTFPE